MSELPPDYYNLLGINPDADSKEIKDNYRRLARENHPDVNPSVEAGVRMRQLNEAHSVLSNAQKRQRYDFLRSLPPDIALNTIARPDFIVDEEGQVIDRIAELKKRQEEGKKKQKEKDAETRRRQQDIANNVRQRNEQTRQRQEVLAEKIKQDDEVIRKRQEERAIQFRQRDADMKRKLEERAKQFQSKPQ